jgi:CRP/FNR family transcriptional regulator, cyclic AMP receptor protein
VSLLATRIELLQGMPFFGGIRSDAIEVLLDGTQTVAVAAGACFFREGDRGDAMFVLEAGRVEVPKAWHGVDHRLHDLGVGDCFGEMSLMDLGPRSATIRALADSRAIEIGAGQLLKLFERDVEQFALVQMNIGREVCRRLRAADELLSHLAGPPG